MSSATAPGTVYERYVRSSRPLATSSCPWRGRQLAVTITANLAGLVLVTVGIAMSGDTDVPATSLRWFEISTAGLVLAGAGNAWHVWAAQRVIGAARVAAIARSGRIESWARGIDEDAGLDQGFVARPDSQIFHRATCVLVTDKPTVTLQRARHIRDGRSACGACEP